MKTTVVRSGCRLWPAALLIGAALGAAGCKGSTKVPSDAEALAALEAYSPSAELDDAGRVLTLKLEGTQVDDAALDAVARMPELKSLSLYGSSVTDAGLAKLAAAANLEGLGLGKTAVTRRGLAHLERLPALRWVWVTDCPRLTGADIEAFKSRAVPGVTVYR